MNQHLYKSRKPAIQNPVNEKTIAWSVSTLDDVISIEFDDRPLSELVVLVLVEFVAFKVRLDAPSSASI